MAYALIVVSAFLFVIYWRLTYMAGRMYEIEDAWYSSWPEGASALGVTGDYYGDLALYVLVLGIAGIVIAGVVLAYSHRISQK